MDLISLRERGIVSICRIPVFGGGKQGHN